MERPCVLNTFRIGAFSTACVSRIFSKAGDSSTRVRIQSPTSASGAPSKNGTRHPHDSYESPVITWVSTKTNNAAITGGRLDAVYTIPTFRPRVLIGECSATKEIEPIVSPAAERP